MHRLLTAPAEYTEEFRDGLGVRYLRPGSAPATVSVLRLCRDLAAARTAVLDRVDRLSTLRLGPFPPLRSAGAPPDDSFALEIISDHVPGVRLIDVLELAGAGRLTIDPEAALHIVRQVLGALASLHESRGVSHGAIGPERLVITPRGQVMVMDYVLGLALEQMGYPSARLWMEMRIPVPPVHAAARFDEQTDVLQVGVLALALLAGRPLDVDDYPDRLASLVDSLGWRAGRDGQSPLIDAVGDWLRSVLQLGTRRRPPSARQAQTRLEAIVSKWRPAGAPASPLKALLGDYHRGRGAGLDGRRRPIEQIVEPPVFAVARRRTLTLVPDAGVAQTEDVSIEAAPTLAQTADAIVAPTMQVASDLPELRVRRRPALVIVPEAPEPAREDSPRTGPPPMPEVVPDPPEPTQPSLPIGMFAEAPVEAPSAEPAEPNCDPGPRPLDRDTRGSRLQPAPSRSWLKPASSTSPETAMPTTAGSPPPPVRPQPAARLVGTRVLASVGQASARAAHALRTTVSVVGGALAAAGATFARTARMTGREAARATSALTRATFAFARVAWRALSVLAARGAAGLSVAVRVSWTAGKAAARGLRMGAAASGRAAAIGWRLAVAGGRAIAVRLFAGLVAGSRAGRVIGRGLVRLIRDLTPVVGRCGRSAASVGVRAVSWSLRMTGRGVVVAARATASAGSGTVLLAGRAVGLGADAARHLRGVRLSRPVVIATLILASIWPGVRLARAWWPDIQARFDTSGGSDNAVAPSVPASMTAGTLRIRSEPAGAEVWLEGKLEGRTPLTVDDVRPGRRSILLAGPAGSIRTDVHVRPGEAVDVVVPIYSGWIAVFAPIDLRILERGTLVGTTGSGRILISPGEHVLDLVSEQYGFTERRTAVVKPGEVTALNIEMPPVPLEVSAPEGAEIWLDGRLLGTSPLPRQTAQPGTSVIVMRHPTMGERQLTATLTYRQTPNRAVF